jgi:hypothetical protein
MTEREDRRLSGFRAPRRVDLDGCEARARIQRMVDRMRARASTDPWHEAYKAAVTLRRLRQTGFTDADRAELMAWLDATGASAGPAQPLASLVASGPPGGGAGGGRPA